VTPFLLFLCSLGLLAGSTVKGVVGIGMPLVAVPILTMLVNLKTAVTLTTVPVAAANLVQSFQSGLFFPMLRRFCSCPCWSPSCFRCGFWWCCRSGCSI